MKSIIDREINNGALSLVTGGYFCSVIILFVSKIFSSPEFSSNYNGNDSKMK